MVVWVARKDKIKDTDDGYGWTYVAGSRKEVKAFLSTLGEDAENWTMTKERDYYFGA